jgi:hypothetical protein
MRSMGRYGTFIMWTLSHRADPEAREIADRHYNRQKPGTPQFVPPGRCMVLKRDGAFWVTSFPFARYVKHEWAGAYVCSAFRRERGPLASELIKAAAARTIQFHLDRPSWFADPLPALGMVTFIDEGKVRSKVNFGYCYLRAGFKIAGRTKKDNLLALRMPLSIMLRLWTETCGIGRFPRTEAAGD